MKDRFIYWLENHNNPFKIATIPFYFVAMYFANNTGLDFETILKDKELRECYIDFRMEFDNPKQTL